MIVRRRRKRTVHHDTPTDPEVVVDPGEPTESVQVHPTRVETNVPMGKKVRVGESRKKKKESRRERSKDPTSEAVGRASRLAANLSQFIVNLSPTESEAPTSPDQPPMTNEARRGRSKSRGKSSTSAKRHKSLSPEKRLATSLAESVTYISRSFEKLDLIGHRRRQRKRRKSRKSSADRKRKEEAKELTIAKLGRFKFSLEVNGGKQTAAEHQRKKHSSSERKTSRTRRTSKQPPSSEQQAKSSQQTKSPQEPSKPPAPQRSVSVDQPIVSKMLQSDRPLREKPIDYRMALNKSGENKKFRRSTSVPESAAPSEKGKDRSRRLGVVQNDILLLSTKKPSEKQEAFSRSLKRQIQSKLQEDEDEDSDSSLSDSKQRLSPPTQVQSLSSDDGSTAGDVSPADRRISRQKILESVGVADCSSSSSSSSSVGGDESSRHGISETNSRAHLITSSSDTSEDEEVAAANRHVRGGSDVAFIGCDDRSGESLDYIRKYGQVPQILSGRQAEQPVREDEDSITILTDSGMNFP